jgi:hypothetical protein
MLAHIGLYCQGTTSWTQQAASSNLFTYTFSAQPKVLFHTPFISLQGTPWQSDHGASTEVCCVSEVPGKTVYGKELFKYSWPVYLHIMDILPGPDYYHWFSIDCRNKEKDSGNFVWDFCTLDFKLKQG